MYTIVAASALAVLAFLAIMKLNAGRRCLESRSVLLRVPLEVAWMKIRDFGALHAAHGRGRPLLRVESSTLRHGDGLTPGTVWRQAGCWGDEPWWSDIELISVEPPHRLEVTLIKDVFGTRCGLVYHRCYIELKPVRANATKLTFRLRARTRGPRLTLARTFFPERMHARLFDLGLRSLKIEIEGLASGEPEPGMARESAPVLTGYSADMPARHAAGVAIPMKGVSSRPLVHDRA